MSAFRSARGLLALLLLAVLTLSVLLSALFVWIERHHDCTGDHCLICAAVARSVAFLKAEGASTAKPAAAARAATPGAMRLQVPADAGTAAASPVSLKVKLTD